MLSIFSKTSGASLDNCCLAPSTPFKAAFIKEYFDLGISLIFFP